MAAKKDNRIVAGKLPDGDDGQDGRPIGRRTVPVDRADMKRLQLVIDHAVRRIKQAEHHQADDQPGDEVRQKYNGLRQLLVEPGMDLVQRDGQDHGQAETEDEKQRVKSHRIERHANPIVAAEKELEVIKAVPFAPPICPSRRKIS
ncbi:hypothetical protein [Cohnella rhizosphaerae]|uniref:Uncharacterized protein n=1 Tax=Cohnella rhizosphaerae TaxID=1457232 RepID=A0A9X4QRU4_9BACL|nr:hypothetical protein [Cohnella rhizosphaerae]MDG0808604.1 hypothetical protein [Cohnella rhizosphaerae]